MIKPLLRTIPTLSGNVKLACTLLDYNKIGVDTYEANIRGAKIYPLSSQLYQKNINANLLNSTWDFDLKKFFIAYSDTFFESCFNINKKEMPLLDKTSVLYPRNTDFEFGVKRISYSKSGSQYAFFAPIYIDNVNDIPDYFEIVINLQTEKRKVTKYLRVNIAANSSDNKNYIYKYLRKYLTKVDDNVAYMNNTDKTISYYGIDLVNGGFTKMTDSTVSSLFNIKLPMQLFDYTISAGFKRNSLCMKQCLPLCFYFNIHDILTKSEYEYFKFADITFSGAYYKDSSKLKMHDFDWDYDEYTQTILTVNTNNGCLNESVGIVENIMDVSLPAFNDRHIIDYQFANKLTTTFNRWKLKYSSDEYPYITNMSWAFSHNQDSNYKYREYPVSYLYQAGYARIEESLNNRYNLLFPIGNDILVYDDINTESAKKYKSILSNYCLNWFDVVTDKELKPFENAELSIKNGKDKIHWSDVNNGYTYFNSVLYNLNSIYNKLPKDTPKIDKFAVLVYPNTDNVYTEEFIKDNLVFSKYSIIPAEFINSDKNNCNFISNVLKTNENIFNIYNNVYKSKFETNVIFKKINTDENPETYYINARELGVKYEEANIVYNIAEFPGITDLSSFKDVKQTNNDDIQIARAKALEDSIKNLIGDTAFNSIFSSIFYTSSKTVSDISLAIVDSYFEDVMYGPTKQYVPKIFTETVGLSVYNQIDIYRGGQLLNSENKFNVENLSSIDLTKLYINTSETVFNPVNVKLEENTNKINNSLSTQQLFKTNAITFYNKCNIINSQYFIDLRNGGVKENIVYVFCEKNKVKNNKYNYAEVNITGSLTNLLYNAIIELNTVVLNSCNNLLSSTSISAIKYEFLPLNVYNGLTLGTNIIKEIKENFYIEEDILDTENVDNNVLYIHPYNINNICEKLSETLNNGKTATSILNNLKYVNLYGKMLNKAHIIKMHQLPLVNNEYKLNLFKQYKVLVFNENKNVFSVKYKYVKLADELTADFILGLNYDVISGMFYDIVNNVKKYYNIVDFQKYYKINKELFDLTNVDNTNDNQYLDIFVYRPLKDLEYDEKFCKLISTPEDIYNCEVITTENYEGLTNTDTMLYPCFNDFYAQEKQDTVFYRNICADNIQPIIAGENTYYRYGCSDAMLLVKVSDEYLRKLDIDTNNLSLTKYVLLRDENNISYFTETDEKLYSAQNIGFFTDDNGLNYGYCLINVQLTNTYEFLNIRGILDTDENSLNISQIDEIQLIKYVLYMNSINITENKLYLQQIFKQLCPFIYTNLISYLISLNIMMVPTTFSLFESYSTSLESTNISIKERVLRYTAETKLNNNKIIIQRYTDSIVPNIVEKESINNLYYLKYKTIDSTLIETGKYNSIGDSVIYSSIASIYVPNTLNVYNLSNNVNIKGYNNVDFTYLPLEYKHYNSNKYINLLPELEYSSNKVYTYNDIIFAESESQTIEVFKKCISKYISVKNEDNILFLYKKYKPLYIKDIIGATIGNTNKIYKLTYKFTLL